MCFNLKFIRECEKINYIGLYLKKKGRKERKWKVYIYDKINIELIIEWVLVIVIIGINWIWN